MMSDDGHGLGKHSDGGGTGDRSQDLSDARPGRLGFRVVVSPSAAAAAGGGWFAAAGGGGWGVAASEAAETWALRQGLTLVHFSTQPEPSTRRNSMIPPCVPHRSAHDQSKSGRVSAPLLRALAARLSRPLSAVLLPAESVECKLDDWSLIAAPLPPHMHVLGRAVQVDSIKARIESAWS